LIYENYEKQLMLKDTQYKALQAQINPHFLYNTLNAINWMIKSKMNDEASKMIVALGDLLRAAFIKEPLISVQQEVELLNSYIAIQKIRYDKRAEFIITLDGELQHYAIPRMILQPLVENAISYAVDQSLELCKIKISLFEQRDRLVIEVEDDGPGMEPELLEKVRHFEMKPIGNGIGLKNIKERLNLIFEQQFEFDIDSTLGEGTKVRIVVPRYNTQSV
jgi:two-component system sensor histidine kinase YesM